MGGEDLGHEGLVGTRLLGDHGRQHRSHAEGGHRLGRWHRIAERPEHGDVEQQPHQRLEQEGDGQRRREPHRAADVDGGVERREGVEQRTLPQEGVGVGAVQGDGPRREVEDTRAAVGHHQRHGQRGEHCTVADAEQEEVDVFGHEDPSPWESCGVVVWWQPDLGLPQTVH